MDEFVRAFISGFSMSGSRYLPDRLNSLQSGSLMWGLRFEVEFNICKMGKGKMARRRAILTGWL